MEKKSAKVLIARKILAMMMAVAVVFCLSGCIRFKTTATVNKDGTVDMTVMYAEMNMDMGELTGDDGMRDESANDDIKELMDKAKDADWDVKPYSKDDYNGFTATKEGIDLEDLPDELDALDLGFDDFTVEKDGKLYTIEWGNESNESKMSGNGLDNSTITSSGGYCTLIIELPVEPEDENASDVSKDGKKLEWDMLNMDEPAHVEFKLASAAKGGGFPMWIIGVIIGGVVIIAGVIVAIVIISSSKKKKAANAAASAVQAAPAAPYAPYTPAAPATQYAPPAQPAQYMPPAAPAAPAAPVAPTPVAPSTPTPAQSTFPQTSGLPTVGNPTPPSTPASNPPTDQGLPKV